jgi:hypothetical protein
VFVRDEVMLEISFDEARGRLAKLDSWFLTASDHAHAQGIAAWRGSARWARRPACPGWPRCASSTWRLRMAEPGWR